jgi:hypothetical protein
MCFLSFLRILNRILEVIWGCCCRSGWNTVSECWRRAWFLIWQIVISLFLRPFIKQKAIFPNLIGTKRHWILEAMIHEVYLIHVWCCVFWASREIFSSHQFKLVERKVFVFWEPIAGRILQFTEFSQFCFEFTLSIYFGLVLKILVLNLSIINQNDCLFRAWLDFNDAILSVNHTINFRITIIWLVLNN